MKSLATVLEFDGQCQSPCEPNAVFGLRHVVLPHLLDCLIHAVGRIPQAAKLIFGITTRLLKV